MTPTCAASALGWLAAKALVGMVAAPTRFGFSQLPLIAPIVLGIALTMRWLSIPSLAAIDERAMLR